MTEPASPHRDSSTLVQRALAGLAEDLDSQSLRAAGRVLAGFDEPPPTRLGEFRLLHELGRGGMGVVYEAEQVSVPGRRVAVKLLHGLTGSTVARQRFAREVAVVGRLDHPNIVPILSADVSGQPPFYAMKRVQGVTLRALLASGSIAPTDYRGVAVLARELALALHHAHRHGVVHRDVKPSNIVVEQGGRPMLLDFGLARLPGESSDLTLSSDAVGTLDYMAPEQVEAGFGEVGARTDVYALGVTMFECLTGRPPFTGPSRAATLHRIVTAEPPPLRTRSRPVPRDLEAICVTAMQRDPDRRYLDAAQLADDLDAFLAHRPIRAHPLGWAHRVRRTLRRHRFATSMLLAAALAFLVAAGYWAVWLPAQAAALRLDEIGALLSRRDDLLRRTRALHAAQTRLWDQTPSRVLARGVGELERRRLSLAREVDDLEARLAAELEAGLSVAPGDARLRARFAEFAAGRLRQHLESCDHVLRPDDVAAWQRRLRQFDDAGRYRGLLDDRGELSVRCPQGAAELWLCPEVETADGRSVYVDAGDSSAVYLGRAPALGRRVAEGNYALRARLAGHRDGVLPVVVRRRAVQWPRERELELPLVPIGRFDPQWIPVPAGLSLLDDRPPGAADLGHRLEWVDAFEIRRSELELDSLDWDSILQRVLDFDLAERDAGSGWYVALPTPAEWSRAARGADGRPYPWGRIHDFRFSENYWSTVDHRMQSARSGPPAEDTSPFGVRGMAGSLRELCVPQQTTRRIGTQLMLLRGGSYLSVHRRELQLDTVRAMAHNEPCEDACLRLIRRPLPVVPPGPTSWQDDFERSDRTLAADDRGWRLLGWRQPLFEMLPGDERAVLEAGALLLTGFAGNHSPNLVAWHPIDVATHGFAADVALRFTPEDRAVTVRLGTCPWLDHRDDHVVVGINRDRAFVRVGSAQGDFTELAEQYPPMLRPTRFDVSMRSGPAGLRVVLAADGAVVARLDLTDPPDYAPPRLRYFAVALPTYAGITAEVLSVSVEAR